jgi:hypothetical protein
MFGGTMGVCRRFVLLGGFPRVVEHSLLDEHAQHVSYQENQ